MLNNASLWCAIFVSVYWLIVLIKVMLITPKIGKAPNVIPKEPLGLISRFFMLPLIICWIYLPWQAAIFQQPVLNSIAWIGVCLALLAVGLSCYCWYYMGALWRIGIDPKEKNQLITDGPFKTIRHPIYALSMLLVLACLLVVQTRSMFFVFCVHWILFGLEAWREERYLLRVHGTAYEKYIQSSRRFFPY